MKLTSINITNFRGCRSLDVPNIDGSLMLLGMNGAGKTSALMALQWALTGQCYDKLGKQKKLSELIGAGDKNAKVSLTIEHDGETYKLDCTAGAKASQIVLTYGDERLVGAEARTKLLKLCGYDMTHAHASAHPHAYVLSDDLYVRLSELGDSLDKEALAAHCGENWPWLTQWCKEIGAKLDSVEGLRKLGKMAYEERTAVNRDIKRLDLRLEELPKSDMNPDDAPKAQALLDKLRKDRDSLLQSQALATTGRTMTEIEAEANELQETLNAIPLPEDVGGIESDVQEGMRQHSTIMQKTNGLSFNIDNLRKKLKDGNCPTCKQPLPKDETLDRAAIQAEIDGMEAQKEALNAEAAEILNVLARHRDALSVARKTRDDLVARRAKVQARLDMVLREQPRPEFDDVALTTLEGRIAKGEALLASLRDAAERKRAIEARAAAKHREQMLTWVVTQFRDGEAQAVLGAGAQDQFVAAVNGQLEPHGYLIKLRNEGGNLIAELWRKGRTYGASFYDVSDGELLIVQSIIAETLGCGFAIIDRIGDLDEGNRLTWFKRLAGEQQYIFAATWVKPGVPDVAAVSRSLGCTVAWLDRDESVVEAAA